MEKEIIIALIILNIILVVLYLLGFFLFLSVHGTILQFEYLIVFVSNYIGSKVILEVSGVRDLHKNELSPKSIFLNYVILVAHDLLDVGLRELLVLLTQSD